jgi:hypothetical protein
LHLLEVGLRWLPDTFLCWKLEGLTACGMEVTVASRAVFEDNARLRGVELIRIPPPDHPSEKWCACSRATGSPCSSVRRAVW